MIGICGPSSLALQPATPHPSSAKIPNPERSHRVQGGKRLHSVEEVEVWGEGRSKERKVGTAWVERGSSAVQEASLIGG